MLQNENILSGSNSLDMDHDRVKAYIRDKSSISIPELQLNVGISYARVKEIIARLTEEGLITEVIDGARYGINTELAGIRTLTRDEALAARALLRDEDVSALAEFKNGTELNSTTLAKYVALMNTELLVQRGSKLYFGCDGASVNLIRSFDLDDFDWFVEKITYELTLAALRSKGDAKRYISELSTVSDEMKNTVLAKAEEYRKRGEEPRPISKKVTLDRVKFMLIESLLLANDFPAADGYVGLIKRDVTLLRRMGVGDGDFLLALTLAEEEMSDLSAEFIRDVRKLLS